MLQNCEVSQLYFHIESFSQKNISSSHFSFPCCGWDPHKQSKLTKPVCKGISVTWMWKRTSLLSTDCSIGPKKLYARQKMRFLEALYVNLLLLLLKSVLPSCWAPIKIPKYIAIPPNKKKTHPNKPTQTKHAQSVKKNKFSLVLFYSIPIIPSNY